MRFDGKRFLITGVMTRASIAFSVAEQLQREGGEVVLTGFGRARRLTERAAQRLPHPPDVLELDVTRPQDFAALAAELERRWGRVDGALHAVAYAPPDALGGRFLSTPAPSALAAFETSAFSLKSLTAALMPLMPGGGGIVALDFDAPVLWPAYDWMAVAKAGLRSIAHYLARETGSRGVRVNLVSAGPLRTTAAGAVPLFDELASAWTAQAPAGWDAEDPTGVAEAVCFLLSDAARAITGETIHADGGMHAMGGLQGPPAQARIGTG